MRARRLNHKPRVWLLGAMLLIAISGVGFPASNHNLHGYEAADRIDLVPTPQEITLSTKQFPLNGWYIVAPEQRQPIQSGVDEINDRITMLGGRPLPVLSKIVKKNLILVAQCTDSLAVPYVQAADIGPDRPGEQGYAIRCIERDGRTIVLALGCDELGVLYACMTLRQLIQRGEAATGSPALLCASVRDWPAFKQRCFGCVEILDRSPARIENPEQRKKAYEEEYGPYIRYLAQNKVNFTNMRGLWQGLQDPRLPVYRQASDFARRYGIRLRMISGTAINDYIEPEQWTDCIVRRDAWHCWTAHEAHRQKARDMAELARRLNLSCQVLHVVDTGGLLDPERWSQRCERCRAEYGDDHAKAVIDQMRLYYKTLHEAHPECLFEAVIQPYHFQWTVDGFVDDPVQYTQYMPGVHHLRTISREQQIARIVEERAAYHRRIAKGLPPEILVTFREGGRPEFDGVCNLWRGHPVDIWYYLGRNRGWKGLWKPQCRFLKTWWRDEPRDLLFSFGMRAYHGFQLHEVDVAANAEYAWSLKQPDAGPAFHISKRFYSIAGRQITPYQHDSLIPRIARRLWGRSADPLMYLLRHNVSLPYITEPGAVAGLSGERFDDPYKYFEEQAKYLEEALARLNTLLAGLEVGKPSGVYGDIKQEYGYRSLLYLDYFVSLGAAKGAIEAAVLRSHRLADEGRYDESLDNLDKTISRLPEILDVVDRAKKRFASEPIARRFLTHATRAGAGKVLANYDFSAQSARLRKVREQIRQESIVGTIPSHLEPILADRQILAAPVEPDGSVRIDGRTRERQWSHAQAIEFFTTRRGRQLARFDTRARLLWDEDVLYVYADMLEDEGVRPASRFDVAGVELPPEDAFTVVLAKPSNPPDWWRFSVTPSGRKTASRADQKIGAKGDWQAGTTQAAGRWTVELRIAFSIIGNHPQPGDQWRVNLIRRRVSKPASPGQEVSCVAQSCEPAGSEQMVRMVFIRRVSMLLLHGC